MRKTILSIFILASIFLFELQAQDIQYKIIPDLSEQMQIGLKELTLQTHNGTERALELRQNPTDSSWVLVCLNESVPYLVKKYQKDHANQKFIIKLVPLKPPAAITPTHPKGEASNNSVLLKCVIDNIPQTNQDRVMKNNGVRSIRKIIDNQGDSVWVLTCAQTCDKTSLEEAIKEKKGKEVIACHFEEIDTPVIPTKQVQQSSQAKTTPTGNSKLSGQGNSTNTTASTTPQSNKPATTTTPYIGKYAKTMFLLTEDTTLFKVTKTFEATDIHPAMRSYYEMAKIIQNMSDMLSYIHDYIKSNNTQKINDYLDKISEADQDLDAYRDKEMKCLSREQQTFYNKIYDEFGKLWDQYK